MHLALVNVFEYICDHWRSRGTAVNSAANIAFVNSRERISRLVGRQKSGEPRRRAFLVFWSPLRGTGFTSDFDIIEAGLMRSAAGAINNIDHSAAHVVDRLGREAQCSFRAHLVRAHDLVIKRLHVLNLSCRLERSSIGDDSHGLS